MAPMTQIDKGWRTFHQQYEQKKPFYKDLHFSCIRLKDPEFNSGEEWKSDYFNFLASQNCTCNIEHSSLSTRNIMPERLPRLFKRVPSKQDLLNFKRKFVMLKFVSSMLKSQSCAKLRLSDTQFPKWNENGHAVSNPVQSYGIYV